MLQSLRPLFTNQGYHVLLFNSRGVGGSSGRASFTGIAEVRDLEGIVRWAIDELFDVQHVVLMVRVFFQGSLLSNIAQGYSHGSLIASMHPSVIHVESNQIHVHRILLSYPLSVRGWLTFFSSDKYQNALTSIIEHEPESRILVLYGTSDQFTSTPKYRHWVQNLSRSSGKHPSMLTTHEVESADHFWHADNSMDELCRHVESWLTSLSSIIMTSVDPRVP